MKCSYCNQILSDDAFESHSCDLRIADVKTINVAYFRDDTQNGKKRVIGRELDCVLYAFEVVPRKAIPVTIPLNRRKVTYFANDDEETEPGFHVIIHHIGFWYLGTIFTSWKACGKLWNAQQIYLKGCSTPKNTY